MKPISIICIICTTFIFFTSCQSSNAYVKKYYKKLDEQTVFVETQESASVAACIEDNYLGELPSPLCATLLRELPDLSARYVGTGTFVKYNGKTTVLTAEHVCYPNEVPDEVRRDGVTLTISKTSKVKINSREFTANAKILKKDAALDLCILELDDEPDVRVAKIAKKRPKRADHIFYAGAPYGLMSENFLLTYEGKYSGTLRGAMVFSLPCAQGASGSAIRNHRNRIVSMVQRVHPGFNHVCFGVSTESLIDFMSNEPTSE